MTTMQDVRAGWDAAACQDAMGHILTTGTTWDSEAFYANGRQEIDYVLGRLDGLELRGDARDLALDFGCGVGRCTVALAEHYDSVCGVDVSGEMIDRARPHDNVTYCQHDGPLAELGCDEFDLIYTNLVLQHMPQPYAHAHIREFLELLAPGGLAVFEIPEGPDLAHGTPCLSMWGTPRDTIHEIVESAGGEILDEEVTCDHATWTPYRYTTRRRA